MTELVLKSKIHKKKLDSIVFFLKAWDIDVEVKSTATKRSNSLDPFAEVRGIWAERNMDAKELRKQAWKIEND
jgi:hypothetical protein